MWGAIFSAYAPKLEIIHRAGHVHSNVDPLSRLPRAPPAHISPLEMKEPSIWVKETLDECQEVAPAEKMAAFTFAAWLIKDCLDEPKEALINVRLRNKKLPNGEDVVLLNSDNISNDNDELEELDTLNTMVEYWGAVNPLLTISLAMSEDAKQQWKSAYLEDPMFRSIVLDDSNRYDKLSSGRRFFVDPDGMIFFNNEDYQPRLCVTIGQRNSILAEAHKSPLESAHAGPEHLWHSLSSRFYWKRMKLDIIKFCRSCDMCQKTKSSNFTKFGMLIPNPTPSCPYQSILMDFIVNLPWSKGYNAIYVVVNQLTKHASFISMTMGLDAEGLALLFVKVISC